MSTPVHYIAIFGGAISGSEAAFQFAQRGMKVAVFEQNVLPYGKIEDGLPKWHVKLRDKEEGKINEKLSHPLIEYVPGVALGKDLPLEEVAEKWGFSAILLANGAWKDRPLSIEGIEAFEGKGLYYQNPFIHWFNHYHEPGYQGEAFDTPDGAIIVGGGLASLDVAKVLMFENVQRALKAKGHEVNLFTLDKSIAKVLESLNLTLEELGVKGCTLFYRRRIKDMPLTPMATDTPELLAKAQRVREKVFNNYQSKYLFNFEGQHVPVDKIVEDGRLAGLVFRKTVIEKGRVIEVEGSETEVRAPLVIASIGSIPIPIEGIPMQGSVYRILQDNCCQVSGFEHVFALGNAVTGRGNILESMKHGRMVSQELIEKGFDREKMLSDILEGKEAQIDVQVTGISSRLGEPLDEKAMEAIDARVKAFQKKAGYKGNFKDWVKKHLPVRLEEILGLAH